jgi:HEAT repeat protein
MIREFLLISIGVGAALAPVRAAAQTPGDTVTRAREVLAGSPREREAAAAKIEALVAAHDLARALDVYDAYARGIRDEDPRLISPIARAELQGLSHDPADRLRIAALEALARAGDARARTALLPTPGTGGEGGSTFWATRALATLGEQAAQLKLAALARDGSGPMRIEALGSLEHAAGDTTPIVMAGLGDRDPLVRTAAARAAGRLLLRSTIPALRSAREDPVFLVRLTAAAALRQLGDPDGDAPTKAALASALPDARLLAASAFAAGSDKHWVGAVQPLLTNPDGIIRLQAAAMLLRDARQPAMETLRGALADPNPAIRAEAARALASDATGGIAGMRVLLRDRDPWVRFHAASAVLAQAPAPR